MPKKNAVVALDFYKNKVEADLSELKWRPAAYAIVIKDQKILLLKQINGYDLPGGGIKIGETPEDAVMREVKEETGLTVRSPKLVDCGTAFFKGFKSQKFYQAIAIYYACDYVSGQLSSAGFDKLEREFVEKPVWLDVEELDNIMMASYREYRGVVRKVLSHENNRD